MISEAYELFGCNNADLFVISIDLGDTDAECIQFDQTYGIEFPTISGIEGGGDAINSTYGINAYPTYILIAPDHTIVEQDMWPINTTQTFVDYFESNGLTQSACDALTASFTSDVTTVCSENAVAYTVQSNGTITSWSWTFEGGDPDTSSEQNPTVTYNTAGIYDVSLEVSDGANTAVFTAENYIEVLLSPPAMLQPFDDVCYDDPAFELSGGSPVGGDYSGPGVTDNWFDPAVAGLGTHTIVYTYTASNGCFNSDEQSILVDICEVINPPNDQDVNIYPNPTSGKFRLEYNAKGNSEIQVMNLLGVVIYRTTISASGQIEQDIDLSGMVNGLYFISIKTKDDTRIQKLKLSD